VRARWNWARGIDEALQVGGRCGEERDLVERVEARISLQRPHREYGKRHCTRPHGLEWLQGLRLRPTLAFRRIDPFDQSQRWQ
jgi:hypothetical protein